MGRSITGKEGRGFIHYLGAIYLKFFDMLKKENVNFSPPLSKPDEQNCSLRINFLFCFSEFQTMINPQVVKAPPKYSFRNLRKYLPQLKEMARKEGIAREQKKKEEAEKKPLKVNTVLSVFKDEKVPISL